MNRRKFLAGVGSVGVAGTLAGCFTPVPSGGAGGMGAGGGPAFSGGEVSTAVDPQAYTGYFDEVVNAVEVGADATGQESINPILNSYARPGTLLVFPSGEYLMTRPHRITRSGPVGIVGQNAVIRHGTVNSISGHRASGQYSGSTEMFSCGSSGDPFSGFLVFGGFVFDFSAENSGMQALNAHTTGEAIVENIQIHGQQDLGTHGPFRLSTQSNESVMMIRNIDMRYGGKHYVNTINTRQTPKTHGSNRPGPSWSTSGMTITSTMSGTMLAENINCGAWPDNGLYLKGGEPDKGTVGRKIIRNCRVANANVANIRTNDGPAWEPHPWVDGEDGTPAQGYEQSAVENCTVTVNNNYDPKIYGNQMGIRLDDGAPILRNSRVTLREPNGTAIRAQDRVSGALIDNVQVDLYAPERGIVMAGSGDVVNSVVNTVGFTASSAVVGVSSGVTVQQVSAPPQQAGPQQSGSQGNQGNQGNQQQ